MRLIAFARTTTVEDRHERRHVGREDDVVVARERDAEVQHRHAEQRQEAPREHLARDLRRRRDVTDVVDGADDEHRAGGEQEPERLRRRVEHLAELVELRRGGERGAEPHEHRRAPERAAWASCGPSAGPGCAIAPMRGAIRRTRNVRDERDERADPADEQVAEHRLARLRACRDARCDSRSRQLGVGSELRAEAGGALAHLDRRPGRRPTAPSTRAISDAISTISGSPIPAVVHDAVPSRSPLVTNGFSGSFGIAFLLHVIPAASSASCATFPVTPNGRRSTSIRWLSVPPETIRNPSSVRASASALALRTIWAA